MVQLGNYKDLDNVKSGEISTNDMKKTKVKRDDAVKVYDTLMKVKHLFVLNTYNYYRKMRSLSKRHSMQY